MVKRCDSYCSSILENGCPLLAAGSDRVCHQNKQARVPGTPSNSSLAYFLASSIS